MSLCPDCQQETGEANFCRTCFRALTAVPPGRFSGLVKQGLAEPPPPSQWAGPDLSAVTFQPKAGRRPRVISLSQLVAMTLVAALAGGGFYLYQRRNYQEAVRHRTNGVALTRQGDFAAAHRQLAAAPDEPETYRARAELAVAEGQWQEAAEQFRKISVDDADVNAHVDAAALVRAQSLMKEARTNLDTARALSLSDQAESLLDKHHARPQQRAALHFLRATLFERLALRTEAKGELHTALRLDPGHAAARQMLAQWTPPPVQIPPVVHRPATESETVVDLPRLQTQPDYPTYQPPEDDLEDDRDGPDADRPQSGPNGKKRRRRKILAP